MERKNRHHLYQQLCPPNNDMFWCLTGALYKYLNILITWVCYLSACTCIMFLRLLLCVLFVKLYYRRKNKFGLLVALTSGSTATGELYWDDGESMGKYSNAHQLKYRSNVVVLKFFIIQSIWFVALFSTVKIQKMCWYY